MKKFPDVVSVAISKTQGFYIMEVVQTKRSIELAIKKKKEHQQSFI